MSDQPAICIGDSAYLPGHPVHAFVSAKLTRIADLEAENQKQIAAYIKMCQTAFAIEKDRDHWKHNHDEMVRRNAVLRDRPDLKDRAESMQRYEAAVKVMAAELAVRRQSVNPTLCPDELWRQYVSRLHPARDATDSNPICSAALTKIKEAK